MKKNSIIFLLCLFSLFSYSQNNATFLFYNVENLFDTENDSITNDDEYTPSSDRNWNTYRFHQKLTNISKALMAATEWDTPAVIGLCEIENRYVLRKLVEDTPLRKWSLKIIHKESPDHRGIDVALLYNPKIIQPIFFDHFPLKKENGELMKSRDILYFSGIFQNTDTLHFFVNHWPSRYGGVMETKPLRNRAAKLLRGKVDSLLAINTHSKIIIAGDFNDQPTNESMDKILLAEEVSIPVKEETLYNLSANWIKEQGIGTLKYRGTWFVYDQIIVSGAFLKTFTDKKIARIANPSFLLEEDQRHGGTKPFRTYIGYRYNQGFSDHLPIKLRLNAH